MAIRLLQGIHVPHRKNTSKCVPVRMPAPEKVMIPVSMHIGAPAKPVVKAGDEVKVGQLIAEASGFVSSPVYASVSGKVKKIEDILLFHGGTCPAVIIESDGEQALYEGIAAPKVTDKNEFLEAVRNSGVVGIGGAGFPTAVKLNTEPGKVDFVCINGAECEPYITTDTRTMLDDTEYLVKGIELLNEYVMPKKVLIGIENNKPECISKLKKHCSHINNVEVRHLPSIYPQGGEKVLIYSMTGRIVSEGKLPIDAGCIVINTTTLAAIAKYIETGMPLTEKYVTVDGSAVKNPQNVIAPIGTAIKDVVEFTGGFAEVPKKIVMGGPMMGIAVPDIEYPVLKNTNSLLCLDAKEALLPPTTACIKCGRCVDHCPLKLMPTSIETAYNKKSPEELKELKVNLCMECGCCAFVCPAKRPLVQVHKLSKAMLNQYNAEQRAAEKAKEEKKQKEDKANG